MSGKGAGCIHNECSLLFVYPTISGLCCLIVPQDGKISLPKGPGTTNGGKHSPTPYSALILAKEK